MVRRGIWTAAALAATLAATLAFPVAAQSQDTGVVAAERRAVLQQQLSVRLGTVVRERLGLSDEQAQRLQDVDRRYQPERRRLVHEEMEVRRGLHLQLAAGENADQRATAALLDRMLALQRERAELQAREQRELAAFLTPVQRAQLLGLQADLHRRVIIMRRGGPGMPRGVRFR